MLSGGIIIWFIICCMSFQNAQSFICLKITSSFHFSAQDLSHIVSFFELWTKKPLYHHRAPRHLSLSVRRRPRSKLCTWSWTAPRITLGKEQRLLRWSCSTAGGRREQSGVFVWTGDALLHNEWSALCGPDSFNMGLHASTYKLGGTSCQNRSKKIKQKKSQQWQI